VFRGSNILIAALVTLAPACSSGSGSGDVEPVRKRVTVEVENQNALPMEIHAIGSGISHRLGTVHPGMRGTFEIPQNLTGGNSVVLEARPNGTGRSFRSGDLLITPGSVLDFMIMQQLFSSTVVQRP
jgi:hypothetical protein